MNHKNIYYLHETKKSTLLPMHKIFLKCHLQYFFLCLAAFGIPFSGHMQNFPPLSVLIEDSAAAQGYYFLVPYTNAPPYSYDHGQLILDHFGRIIFYRVFQRGLNPTPTIDFKLQPNGWMSYFQAR